MTTEYLVIHSDGRARRVSAERWTIIHFNETGEPETVTPSPCAHIGDERHLFDPRVMVVNMETMQVEYNGPAQYIGNGKGDIVRRDAN